MSIESDVTQEESDAAIVQCLRIFAARGRQLRLQRERDQAAQQATERENPETGVDDAKTPPSPAPKES